MNELTQKLAEQEVMGALFSTTCDQPLDRYDCCDPSYHFTSSKALAQMVFDKGTLPKDTVGAEITLENLNEIAQKLIRQELGSQQMGSLWLMTYEGDNLTAVRHALDEK